MTSEQAPQTLIECPLDFSLSDGSGQISGGSAEAIIDETNVKIVPKLGEPITFSPREILEFKLGDYRIELLLTSKETLSLTKLGFNFENFTRVLSQQRNEIVLKDMLMSEPVVKAGLKAEYSFEDCAGRQRGACEPRLYETGLVILPERGEPTRIHYSDISGIEEGDYGLTLSTDSGMKLTISKMGGQFEPFKKLLSDTMNALSTKAQASMKEMAPGADSSMIRRASRYVRDGKAARKLDLDSISPEFWKGLEKKFKAAGMGAEYEHLSSIAQKDHMCAGFKRGLMGDMTGEYIWLLAPVYGDIKSGNAIILEAATMSAGSAPAEEEAQEAKPEGSAQAQEAPAEEEAVESTSDGRATYVFRITGRSEYTGLNAEEMSARADRLSSQISQCLLSINFRREPIYMSDEELENPKNVQYWYSVQRMLSLRTLRGLFVGRVFHRTEDQWKKDLSDLLSFNANAKEDREKWKARPGKA